MVDAGLAVGDVGRVVGADLDAAAAADAGILVDEGLARGVHLHLAGAGTAAHADVLQRAAEAGALVPLEVRQRDEHVGVHDGAADLGFLHIGAALHGDQGLVGALQAVGDDDVAAGGKGRKTVGVGRVDVVQRVLAPAHIQRVAVGQEGLAAQFLDHLGHHRRVVGAQEGQVARLAEMDLDGGEFVGEVDLADPGGLDETFEFLGQVLVKRRAQIGEIYFGCRHGMPPVFMGVLLFFIVKYQPQKCNRMPLQTQILPPRPCAAGANGVQYQKRTMEKLSARRATE